MGAAAISVACGGTTSPEDGGADAQNDQSMQAAYGAVIPDAGPDADSGGFAPPYGVPPSDAGKE